MHRTLNTISIVVLGLLSFGANEVDERYIAVDSRLLSYTLATDNPKVSDIPSSIRQLDGHRVSIDGFMITLSPEIDKVTDFALEPRDASHNSDLHFVPPPTIEETIICRANPAVRFTSEHIRVFGRLHVRVTTDDGFVISLCDMDVDRISQASVESSTWRYVWQGTILILLTTVSVGLLWHFSRRRSHRVHGTNSL